MEMCKLGPCLEYQLRLEWRCPHRPDVDDVDVVIPVIDVVK